jgi:hypothetical protein
MGRPAAVVARCRCRCCRCRLRPVVLWGRLVALLARLPGARCHPTAITGGMEAGSSSRVGVLMVSNEMALHHSCWSPWWDQCTWQNVPDVDRTKAGSAAVHVCAQSRACASHLGCCQLLGGAQGLQGALELLFVCGISSWQVQQVCYLWQGGGAGRRGHRRSLPFAAGHLHLHGPAFKRQQAAAKQAVSVMMGWC